MYTTLFGIIGAPIHMTQDWIINNVTYGYLLAAEHAEKISSILHIGQVFHG